MTAPQPGPCAALAQLRHRPTATGQEALAEPFRAFPSWFLRIECDRCGKAQVVNEVHARWRDRSLRDIIARMRHDGCGGRAGKAELVTGIEGVSSRPVRKIGLPRASAPVLVRRTYRSESSRRKPEFSLHRSIGGEPRCRIRLHWPARPAIPQASSRRTYHEARRICAEASPDVTRKQVELMSSPRRDAWARIQ
jgi:hypothetical protein